MFRLDWEWGNHWAVRHTSSPVATLYGFCGLLFSHCVIGGLREGRVSPLSMHHSGCPLFKQWFFLAWKGQTVALCVWYWRHSSKLQRRMHKYSTTVHPFEAVWFRTCALIVSLHCIAANRKLANSWCLQVAGCRQCPDHLNVLRSEIEYSLKSVEHFYLLARWNRHV